MLRSGSVLLFIILAACGSYPRDIAGTTERVRAERMMRVGIVAGNAAHREEIETYLRAVERAANAQSRSTVGAAEPLLARLEDGQLDLVIGEFAEDTPWLPDATLVWPLAERVEADRNIQLTPVARNGENRWIMLLEKIARDQHPS